MKAIYPIIIQLSDAGKYEAGLRTLAYCKRDVAINSRLPHDLPFKDLPSAIQDPLYQFDTSIGLSASR